MTVAAPTRPAKAAALRHWRVWVPPAAALGTVAAAGVAFQRVFGWDHTGAPLAVGTILGALAGLAGHRLAQTSIAQSRVPVGEWRPEVLAQRDRASGPGALLAALVVAAAVVASATVAAAVFATPAGSAGTGLASLGEGWDRILTTAVPVPPTADRLPLLAALVTLAGALALLAAFRDRPGLLPLFPAAGVFLAALVLGVGGPGSFAAVVVPPAVLGAAYLLAVSRPAGEGVAWLPPARAVAAVATGAGVLAVVVAVGTHFPLATARHPVDLRQSLSRPLDLGQVANPLAELPAIQAAGSAPMFTAGVDRTWLADPSDWQLATLDTYDGISWGTDAKATTVGTVLPVPVDVPGPTAHVQLRVAGLTGPWVPTVGVPRTVSPANLSYDPAAQVLLASRQRRGSSYRLSATLPAPTLAELDAAGIPDNPSVTRLVTVPSCFPAPLRTAAQQAVTNLSRPAQEAVAIEQELADRGGYRINDRSLNPDTSCAGLQQLATRKVGTTQQYATAFALMARSVGLPTRLVVGFNPGVVHGNQVTIRGEDATVWPEVEFARLGWVAFSPFPSATGAAGGPATVPPTTTRSQSGLNRVRQTVAGGASTTLPPVATTAPPAHHGRGSTNPGWWALAALGVLMAVAAAATAGRLITNRRRRALRRNRPVAADRVVGAWQDVLDQLTALGSRAAVLTPAEAVGEAAWLAPASAEAVSRIARSVDLAVYAGQPDEALRPLADDAWRACDTAREAIRGVTPFGLRVRLALLGPGPASAPRRRGPRRRA